MNPVPPFSQAPLPAPIGLFSALLTLTFFLHLIFVGFSLGGSIIAWWSALRQKSSKTADQWVRWNSLFVAMTITTGVPPLLFVQVLYAPWFYSGAIFLGWFWLMLLVFLMIGYYLIYWAKLKESPHPGITSTSITMLAFLAILFLQTAVSSIAYQTDLWSMNGLTQMLLVRKEFWMRLLHNLGGALVIAGVFPGLLATFSSYRINREVITDSWAWAKHTAVAQIATGFLYLMFLPFEQLRALMRNSLAMFYLSVGVIGALALLHFLFRVKEPGAEKTKTRLAGIVAAFVLLLMVGLRHMLRVEQLAAYPWRERTVEIQPLALISFVALALVAVAAVIWMWRKWLAENPLPTTSA